MPHRALEGESPKPPIRVLHVTFNMGIGGTEQVIRQLIEGMDSTQVQSEILCIDGHVGAMGEGMREAAVKIHTIARQPGFDRALVSGIRALLREGDFDIVHCHQYTPYFYGWLAAWGTPARVVFTEHGRFYPDRYRYKALLINPLMALLTSAIVSISEATRDALIRYEFIPRKKIRVIYNGISPLHRDDRAVEQIRESLGIPREAFVVGTVSRLDPVKNQTMMLRAFRRFSKRNPDAWLLMVGDGPDRQKLEQLAIQLKIGDRSVFTGFVNKPAQHLAAMDIFLLSSHTEGTSMTLLEAMSMGIPPVVTKVGGNPEILTAKLSRNMVPTDDADAFSEAITALWSDEKLRTAQSTLVRDIFQNRFSNTIMVKSYMELYKSVC